MKIGDLEPMLLNFFANAREVKFSKAFVLGMSFQPGPYVWLMLEEFEMCSTQMGSGLACKYQTRLESDIAYVAYASEKKKKSFIRLTPKLNEVDL